MILKFKHVSSCLAPTYIDQIADISPEPGQDGYYMTPAPNGQQKWTVHTRIPGGGMDVGLLLEDDCMLLDGHLRPENCSGEDAATGDEVPPQFAIRALKLTLRDGETRTCSKTVYYATDFYHVFIMSDDGKTIDRLPK